MLLTMFHLTSFCRFVRLQNVIMVNIDTQKSWPNICVSATCDTWIKYIIHCIFDTLLKCHVNHM